MCGAWSLVWFVMMARSSVNCVDYDVNQTAVDEEDMVAYGTVYDSVKYPYVMYVIGHTRMCTGSLIQPLFVLTAAHCTWGKIPSDMMVSRGHLRKSNVNSELKRPVRVIYQHHGYKHNHYHTPDISLLEIEYEYKGFNSFVEIGGTPEEFGDGKEMNCIVIGFGRTETQIAPKDDGYQTDVVVRYGQNACAPSTNVRNDDWKYFLCSKPDKKMVCHGDSGGPLICGNKQYGSAKSGYNYVTNDSTLCGSPLVQTRHIFLYMFKEWIDEILEHPSHKNNAPIHRRYLITLINVTLLPILTASRLFAYRSA